MIKNDLRNLTFALKVQARRGGTDTVHPSMPFSDAEFYQGWKLSEILELIEAIEALGP